VLEILFVAGFVLVIAVAVALGVRRERRLRAAVEGAPCAYCGKTLGAVPKADRKRFTLQTQDLRSATKFDAAKYPKVALRCGGCREWSYFNHRGEPIVWNDESRDGEADGEG